MLVLDLWLEYDLPVLAELVRRLESTCPIAAFSISTPTASSSTHA
jgi:hypothetical protein